MTIEDNSSAEELLKSVYAILEGVEGIINRGLADFTGSGPDIYFKDRNCVAISAIRMTDFISAGKSGRWTRRLSDRANAVPTLDLSKTVECANAFEAFLGCEFEMYYPGALSIDGAPEKLKMSRDVAYFIAGNFEKHSVFRLNRCAEKIRSVLSDNGVDLSINRIVMEIESLSDIFVDDFYVAKAQHLGELLTALYHQLHEDLQDEYIKSLRIYEASPVGYRFEPTFDVGTEFSLAVYWSIMNKVRRKPILPMIEATAFQRTHF